MKLEIVNRGEYRVKVMERGEEKGTPESPDYDNGIKETMLNPGEAVAVVGKFSVIEYTPGSPLPALLTDTYAG